VSRSNLDRLRDILESIEAIDRAKTVADRYAGDDDVTAVALDAIIERIFVIGEAVKCLDARHRTRRPEVPWSDIIRMRDLIGHHYYKVDPEIVRATIERPLIILATACRALAVELSRPAP
jgi:uncharacterized protein with HEPN domain